MSCGPIGGGGKKRQQDAGARNKKNANQEIGVPGYGPHVYPV